MGASINQNGQNKGSKAILGVKAYYNAGTDPGLFRLSSGLIFKPCKSPPCSATTTSALICETGGYPATN